tara:strand:+ start:11919 stop:12086 length:168 start_codon:yes stop_codon:yes gene_type:complete
MSALIHRLCGADAEPLPRSRSLVRLGLTVALVSLYALTMLLVFAPEALHWATFGN